MTRYIPLGSDFIGDISEVVNVLIELFDKIALRDIILGHLNNNVGIIIIL
jgi:hypothetical protein